MVTWMQDREDVWHAAQVAEDSYSSGCLKLTVCGKQIEVFSVAFDGNLYGPNLLDDDEDEEPNAEVCCECASLLQWGESIVEDAKG